MKKNNCEWVIHVWGKSRTNMELTDVEKFHISVLEKYQSEHHKFNKILVNIALDIATDIKLFEFLKDEIGKVLKNDNVEFKYCLNNKGFGEYVTFRPYVFDRIGENVNILYTHFKGYSSFLDITRESYPKRIIGLNENYWSYLMYDTVMNVDKAIDVLKNKSMYSWFILKTCNEGYGKEYQDSIYEIEPKFKEYKEFGSCPHSPGSFVWYNLKRIGDALNDKPEVKSISTDLILKSACCTHFCELYLMQFLKESECCGECDYTDIWVSHDVYSKIYVAKMIRKDLISGFEKILIDNKLI